MTDPGPVPPMGDPRPEDLDVYVGDGALVEVWRGERTSMATMFGVRWDGEASVAMHREVFLPPDGPRSGGVCPACGRGGAVVWVRPVGVGAWRVCALALCLALALLLAGTRWWW